MSSTALFIEILITGLEAVVWLGFLLGCLFGIRWFVFISTSFEVAQALSTTFLIGNIYVIGIIIEEVSDALFEPWSDRLKASLNKGGMSNYNKIQDHVYSHYSIKGDDQLGYMRSRRRILRASAFNIGLTIIFSTIFIWTRLPNIDSQSKISLSVFIVTTGILGTWLSLFAYKRITRDFVHSIQGIYQCLIADENKRTKGSSKAKSFV